MNFNFFGFGKKETKIEEKPLEPMRHEEPQLEELFAPHRDAVLSQPVHDKDEKKLEVLRYSSGADSTLGLLFINGVYGREF